MSGFASPDSTPRYAQPTDPPGPARTCGECAHYQDLLVGRCGCGNGLVGVCCAGRDADGTDGEIWNVDPSDDAEDCADWERAD